MVQIHLLQPNGSVVWRLSHSPVTRGIAGSIPVGTAIRFGFIAQLAEHKTENLGVVGSIPTEATILKNIFCAQSNLIRKKTSALIAQLDRAFDYGSKGYGFDSYWAHHVSGSGSTW